MKWNIFKIKFLHQPEYFLGKFDIPQMQERHEKELEIINMIYCHVASLAETIAFIQ